MDKMQMSMVDVMRWAVLGMKNGNIEAAIAILEDVIKQIETNPQLAPLQRI